ncbi:MAG: DUF58 domain-containing protein [Alphaproteobacteria bacterium]|nr:DUF58 domain-containing protein [Alphaproteobacteria bacterium]
MRLLPLRSEAERAAAQIPDLRALAVKTAFHVLHGANPRKRPGAGEAFWQFREYEPGDMPRAIDWRQSAKGDRIFIRQKEQHNAQSCLFWTKRNADMNFKSDTCRFDKNHVAGVLALTLALLHSRSGEMIGFAGMQRPGHSEKTLSSFEHILMRTAPSALPQSISIPRHAYFYALGDFLESIADIKAALKPLAERTRNGWMIVVLDPAELDLPYEGRIHFEDMTGEQRVMIDNARDIREAYQDRMSAHLQDLQALAAGWGWRFIVHSTDSALEETALQIWLENAK